MPTMRLSTLLAPDLAETLKTSPEHAIALAEELHAVDLGRPDLRPVGRAGRAARRGAAHRAGRGRLRRDGPRSPRPALRARRALARGAPRRPHVGRRARRSLPVAARRGARRPARAHAQGRLARRPRAHPLPRELGGRPHDDRLRRHRRPAHRRARHRAGARDGRPDGDDLRGLRRRSERDAAGRRLAARPRARARRASPSPPS